jgi:hypothetical protein
MNADPGGIGPGGIGAGIATGIAPGANGPVKPAPGSGCA